MARRRQKLVNPNDEPLTVTPLTTAGPQPWHAIALKLRWHEDGTKKRSIREVARLVGKGFHSVQKFFNPASKLKGKKRQAKYERDRRHNDPKYAEKIRDYDRRYAQLNASKRWKKDDGNTGTT